jgi:hypothetical protein
MERRMDNRLGERLSIHVDLRLVSTRPRTTSIGRIKNLSRSGALITDCDLPLFSLIQVIFESHQEPKPDEESVAAYVTRICDDGVGVEWCEFAPPAVAALLQNAIGSSDAFEDHEIDTVTPEAPLLSPPLNCVS